MLYKNSCHGARLSLHVFPNALLTMNNEHVWNGGRDCRAITESQAQVIYAAVEGLQRTPELTAWYHFLAADFLQQTFAAHIMAREEGTLLLKHDLASNLWWGRDFLWIASYHKLQAVYATLILISSHHEAPGAFHEVSAFAQLCSCLVLTNSSNVIVNVQYTLRTGSLTVQHSLYQYCVFYTTVLLLCSPWSNATPHQHYTSNSASFLRYCSLDYMLRGHATPSGLSFWFMYCSTSPLNWTEAVPNKRVWIVC